MASTYSNSGIELIGSGEQSGSWGTTTNTNLEIVDRLINGVGTISLSGTTHTLTTLDGALSDGHYRVLVFGGSPSGTNTVTIDPNNASHVYFVVNNSGQSVIMTQGSGGNVTIPNGQSRTVYCDGGGASASVSEVSSSLTELGVTASAAELNILDGATVTTAEVNILDGVTATTSEINILDGVTATTTELNYVSGVTSAIQTQIDAITPSIVPSGAILMWSGSIASIPSGWYLCDGNNGTPDLRDRFVVGAGSSYAVGATGGAASVTLDSTQIPSHTHTFSGTTNTTGDHYHLDGEVMDSVSEATYGYTASTAASRVDQSTAETKDQHAHTSTAGAHAHTFSGTTSATGGGASHENRPPYYALAYIMKS